MSSHFSWKHRYLRFHTALVGNSSLDFASIYISPFNPLIRKKAPFELTHTFTWSVGPRCYPPSHQSQPHVSFLRCPSEWLLWPRQNLESDFRQHPSKQIFTAAASNPMWSLHTIMNFHACFIFVFKQTPPLFQNSPCSLPVSLTVQSHWLSTSPRNLLGQRPFLTVLGLFTLLFLP